MKLYEVTFVYKNDSNADTQQRTQLIAASTAIEAKKKFKINNPVRRPLRVKVNLISNLTDK